ncbi:carboxypeptidase-like regulatory domain-containing protein [Aureivirga sp. CE67]|uniref:TonB-dependent receptor n=1 Tax=Aureivirga sp. CE67 TaxID=1788983 RepID=UPI0018CA14BF|nr:carboxypeptidase-like regulatory domain-containing protein [Aureivirga sp. CE67]
MKTNYYLTIIFLFLTSIVFGQKATIKGTVKDQFGKPIENVTVIFEGDGTTTAKDGTYTLTTTKFGRGTITFMHVSYAEYKKRISTSKNRTVTISPKLRIEEIGEVEIETKEQRNAVKGQQSVDIEDVKFVPTGNGGVETLVSTLIGASNNNTLSTQYNVRGGNFDENLVYVNGFEVFRPFLIRSGQQEGLSFINSDMVKNIAFSAGGFQAKYGDKLSSVLDITYKKPRKFGVTMNASLLGGGLTVEGTGLKDKLNFIAGARYRDNSLLVGSKDIETNYKPRFLDIQSFLSYKITDKFTLEFLGNVASNQYDYIPKTRRTRFGTVNNPLELIVYYNGREEDDYLTVFGALKGIYKVNDNLKLELTTSAYNTQEEEYYDIEAFYNLGQVDGDFGSDNFGETLYAQQIGSQLSHARNDLDALINNVQLRANYKKDNNEIEVGAKYQIEDIQDRIIEWEMIDSTGFSIRPIHHAANQQPYEPYTGEIVPFQNIRARNHTKISRLSAYAQYSRKAYLNDHEVYFNIGGRMQTWTVDDEKSANVTQTVFSPRAQFAIKPDWENTDMLFRFATGIYYQPPFYRELRNAEGNVNPDVKAQKAYHFILGNEYSFKMWGNRKFKLVTEAYYKNLDDVNIYTVDNVRIRYAANNNAKAYAAGFDMRLNGEFIPGTESWLTIGLLKTEENYENRGYIPRPTDQRFKLAFVLQDYVPTIPNLRMYLNMVYNSGVPGGSPSYADPYLYQTRLNAYRRADIGLIYVFTDAKRRYESGWLKNFRELTLGVELFNMFDIKNSITNTWVRDAYSKTSYGIPNYMTGRVLNVRMTMKI